MPPAATTRRVDPINTFLKKGFWTPKNFLLYALWVQTVKLEAGCFFD
jgi:hypothetical protein